MDAGSTLTFQNSATVGGSEPVFNLPVDLIASGAASGAGGRIIFENNSSASGPPANTFTGLRIEGGLAAGAGGGELIFRGSATMGSTSTFSIAGGEVAGAFDVEIGERQGRRGRTCSCHVVSKVYCR